MEAKTAPTSGIKFLNDKLDVILASDDPVTVKLADGGVVVVFLSHWGNAFLKMKIRRQVRTCGVCIGLDFENDGVVFLGRSAHGMLSHFGDWVRGLENMTNQHPR